MKITEPIKIIIADPYQLFRTGMQSLLSKNPDIELIGEAEDRPALLDLVLNSVPDVVLLGMNLPHTDIVKIIAIIEENFPGTGIIVLSMTDNPHFIHTCLDSGASACLLKNVQENELMIAIHTAARGQKYINQEIEHILQVGRLKQKRLEELKISDKKREILYLISSGSSSIQIAESLALSVRTVESHRLHLLKKLAARNSLELVKTAKELFLID